MNIIYSTILIISTILSSVIGLPISTELGPAIVVKQNKPIIFSPENETIVKPILYKRINSRIHVSPSKDDIKLSNYVVIDGVVIYTPTDAAPFKI